MRSHPSFVVGFAILLAVLLDGCSSGEATPKVRPTATPNATRAAILRSARATATYRAPATSTWRAQETEQAVHEDAMRHATRDAEPERMSQDDWEALSDAMTESAQDELATTWADIGADVAAERAAQETEWARDAEDAQDYFREQQNCDPSYPDVCIPPVSVVGDLDCADLDVSNFGVIDPDPHGFDGDFDGVGCES